ncbi:acyl-CoA-binding domain-containing protein 5A isoform X2 [Phlebotomus argentipes]|uniref:acyl-CoA-binding domain-containing protein 5A isoform X2 n=1 Tax=Phlebotomus argentipes TaxID=94469 RepID=UPI00289341F7|nr:acyl-CoA-binding domain-containing protein 5A isoform X2 [Phlebotomus argentipes]
MSTVQERFTAAVNVIRGLPKNGSYQPSNDMMLKFYSYYKQGTLGPCTQSKPAFWDVVNRAKWQAWKALGDMSQERAMENYVEELKKIIETMSYTDNVAQFMGSISELDGVNVDDLEAVAPEAIKKVRSHPNSPFASRESSPVRAPMNGLALPPPPHVNGNGFLTNGHDTAHQNGHLTEQSDDEYIDTVEDEPETLSARSLSSVSSQHVSRSKVRSQAGKRPGVNEEFLEVLNLLNATVDRMSVDLQQVTNRINIMERSLLEVRYMQASRIRQYPSWWPFEDISPNWFFLLVLWPFVAQKLAQVINRRK